MTYAYHVNPLSVRRVSDSITMAHPSQPSGRVYSIQLLFFGIPLPIATR